MLLQIVQFFQKTILIGLAWFVVFGPQTFAWAGMNVADPIQITADRMESDLKQDTIQFLGHVEAKQAEVIIVADQMTVFYTQGPEAMSPKTNMNREVKKLFAQGNVKITKGEWIATGNALEFYAQEQRVFLTGNAKVWEGDNLVKGERIVLYLEEGKSVVERSEQERVRAFIYPEDKGKDQPETKGATP